MKARHSIPILLLISALPTFSQEEKADGAISVRHAEGSEKLADEQDELSADVQQLVIEQTVPQVIELLGEVEEIMDEATDYLAEKQTGGATIAAQTEIIEKIHQAAKTKQQSSGSGEAGSAMMDMMERMMGKEDKGKEPGKGDKPSDQAGQGQPGDSGSANDTDDGTAAGKTEERTVPKAAGQAGKSLPHEFQQALDAYNRGLEGKTK